MPSQFYNDNASDLAQQYLSKSFEEVHEGWSQFLPSIIEKPNARILDLGAGDVTWAIERNAVVDRVVNWLNYLIIEIR